MGRNTLVSNVLKEKIKSVISLLERNSLTISLSAFFLGIVVTVYFPAVGRAVSHGIQSLIGVYGYFVPFLIYFLLAPALVKIIALAKEYGNGWLFSVLKQFVVARFLAILFVIIVLSLLFRLPFHLNHGTNFFMAMQKVGSQLLQVLFYSPFLYGVYAAVFTMALAMRFRAIEHFSQKAGNGIEYAGKFLIVLSPLFMFAIGSFLYSLPGYLQDAISQNFSGGLHGIFSLLNFNFAGLNLVPSKFVFVALYLLIGLTTGGLCLVWHGLYIAYTKIVQPKFSLKYYLAKYWLKVYPLLWSSSSETLAVPLSLNLMKNNFPEVPSAIRQFVIVGGSQLGINGTLISVYVMAIFLARVLGVEVSFLNLLISLPVVFILGYAVPGIPGELIIFAGTMSLLLGIPPAIAPLFLSLYLTLQIGLPDSFRTGCNSTDSALLAIVSSHRLEEMKARVRIADMPSNATGAPQLPPEENI